MNFQAVIPYFNSDHSGQTCICEEQVIGPVEMAKKFNFRVCYLMFTGFDQNI